MMTKVQEPGHLVKDDRGAVWIAGANAKVMELVNEHLAYGWSADELQEQHPHLTLGQIHSALSYFYDHQAEFETEMKRRDEEFLKLRQATGEAPLQRRLRALRRNK